MPLTYQSPWMPQEAGNSLGELLARVPQVRAQQAMMQQQLMLEQLKAQNEQQYQSGMLGYHSQVLGLQKQQMEQNQPEIDARTQYLLGQTGVEGAKQKELEKVMSLADMFGKAYRKSAGYPSVNDYQGGPTMQNQTALNNGDLAQSEATLEAMRPHDNLMGSVARMQAMQQQGPFSTDQLNALITGGHMSTPRADMGFSLNPGQTRFSPQGQPVASLPETPNSRRSAFEQFVINMGNNMAKGAAELAPKDQGPAMKNVWGLTNLLNNASSKASGPIQVNSKAEYDKLPSGTQYIDPQGHIATKR